MEKELKAVSRISWIEVMMAAALILIVASVFISAIPKMQSWGDLLTWLFILSPVVLVAILGCTKTGRGLESLKVVFLGTAVMTVSVSIVVGLFFLIFMPEALPGFP